MDASECRVGEGEKEMKEGEREQESIISFTVDFVTHKERRERKREDEEKQLP